MATLRKPPGPAPGPLRAAVLAELAERIEHADRAGRRALPDGTVFRHPAVVWLAALGAGRPVELPVHYVRAAARRAGITPPALPASGRVTID